MFKSIFIIGIIIIAIIPAYSMGIKQVNMVPAKPKKLEIRDGELLKYIDYVGGEKVKEVFRVTKIYPKEKTVILYMDANLYNGLYKMPLHYTNYVNQIKISLDKASLVYSYFDITQYAMTNNNFNGQVYYKINIDRDNELAFCTLKVWDGYNLKIMENRIKIKLNYPIWDMDSLFVGFRYLDLSSGGMFYLIAPQIIREPIPGTVENLGKEIVDTPAGKFNTIKFGFMIGDSFLGSLMQPYLKETFVWIEDNERGIIVKAQRPNEATVLEEISVWK